MPEIATLDRTTRLFCSFRLEQRLYGIDLAEVREVSNGLPITPVGHAPAAMRGLANLRSRIYLVLDLRQILGFQPAECASENRLVILRPAIAENVGILVDRGGDIVSVSEQRIERVPEALAGSAGGETASPRFITCICKLESELLMVVGATLVIDHAKRLLS
jgi:purine-binding chemotaxis protein CheW